MNKNELKALAMTGSDEPGHNSTASFKEGKPPFVGRIRVWMANKKFFSTIIRNAFSSKVYLTIKLETYPQDGGKPILVDNDIITSPEIFVSLFFGYNNYEPIVDILGDEMGNAFDLCGNNPRHSQRWHDLTHRRSFSVGDVIQVIDSDKKSKWFMCAPIGWEPIITQLEYETLCIPIIDPKDWR